MTQSQSQSQMDVDEDDLQRLIEECSLFLLNRHTTNLPIKRTDIVNTLMKDSNRKTQTEVLKRTQEVIRRVHGLNMLELTDKVKSYILVNAIPPLVSVEMNWAKEEKKKMILLFLVLSVIYMSGGSMPERGLLNFLKKLRIISDDSVISPFFGNVDHILRKDFVNQKYIEYEAVKGDSDGEDITYVLHWGFRALNEINKMDVLEYVCEILECDMSEFTEQFANMTTL